MKTNFNFKKSILLLLLSGFSFSLPSHSAQANLVTCEYVHGRDSQSVWRGTYKSLIDDLNAKFVVGETYKLLNSAQRAIITSGTATLEAAIFKVPQVICYHGPALVVAAAKRFVKVKYLGLANLIMDKAIVAELIQEDMTPERIVFELSKFNTRKGADKIETDYNDLLGVLGGEGASKRAAEIIINDIK